MGQPIFSGGGGNRLAAALAHASNSGPDMETAQTLMNMDFLRAKMAGMGDERAMHLASARHANAGADLQEQERQRREGIPQAELDMAANASGQGVPAMNNYLENLAGGNLGPYDRDILAQLQRGAGELFRARASTQPNSAAELAMSAKTGAEAQQRGLAIDAALAKDPDALRLIVAANGQNVLKEHPEPAEKGQLAVVHTVMSDMGVDPASPRGQKILSDYLEKLTTRPDRNPDLLTQARDSVNAADPIDPSIKKGTPEYDAEVKKREKAAQNLWARLSPINAMIGDALKNGITGLPPPGGTTAQGSPASPEPNRREVSGKISPPQVPVPARPAKVPPGSQYSPSRRQWRTPNGMLFDESGRPVK